MIDPAPRTPQPQEEDQETRAVLPGRSTSDPRSGEGASAHMMQIVPGSSRMFHGPAAEGQCVESVTDSLGVRCNCTLALGHAGQHEHDAPTQNIKWTAPSPALSVRQQVIAAAQKMQDTDLGYDYTLDAFETRAVLAAAREALTIACDKVEAAGSEANARDQNLTLGPGTVDPMRLTFLRGEQSMALQIAHMIDSLLSSLSGAVPSQAQASEEPASGLPAVQGPQGERREGRHEASPQGRAEGQSELAGTGALTPFDPEQVKVLTNSIERWRRVPLFVEGVLALEDFPPFAATTREELIGQIRDAATIFDSVESQLTAALAEITRLEQDHVALHAEIRAQDAEVTRLTRPPTPQEP